MAQSDSKNSKFKAIGVFYKYSIRLLDVYTVNFKKDSEKETAKTIWLPFPSQ
jgi:hypothetical protein